MSESIESSVPGPDKRLKTSPPVPIGWPMSDRDRERDLRQKPVRRAAPVLARPAPSALEGIGCEPADACLDGEAPLSREPTEP